MRKLCSIILLLFLATNMSAAELKLPETVSGDVGDYIMVRAVTTCSVVKWKSLDKNLKLFPTDLLKDTKNAVVSSKFAGIYHLIAITSDTTGTLSDFQETVVEVGQTPPGPGPIPPGPNPPPTPVPPPTDPFTVSLQQSFSADTDTSKATYKADMAELFRQFDVNDLTLKTPQDVLTRLQTARIALMGTKFAAERTIIQNELNATLKFNLTTPLTTEQRMAMRTEFDRVANVLISGVK